jgi:hypothetical protein
MSDRSDVISERKQMDYRALYQITAQNKFNSEKAHLKHCNSTSGIRSWEGQPLLTAFSSLINFQSFTQTEPCTKRTLTSFREQRTAVLTSHALTIFRHVPVNGSKYDTQLLQWLSMTSVTFWPFPAI